MAAVVVVAAAVVAAAVAAIINYYYNHHNNILIIFLHTPTSPFPVSSTFKNFLVMLMSGGGLLRLLTLIASGGV